MKKLTLILLSILMIVTLFACGDKKCEHTYDHACDAFCNECSEERAVAHDWQNATCITSKTCKICATTEGEPLGHTPEADDGDCATALNCGVCGAQIKAAGEHTPERDDGNCTTEQKCTVCEEIAVQAKDAHNDTDHDYLCDNAGCQVTVGNPPEDKNPGIDLPIDTN